jgi:hypothetical protein
MRISQNPKYKYRLSLLFWRFGENVPFNIFFHLRKGIIVFEIMHHPLS